MKWCLCFACSKVEIEDISVLDFSCSSLTEVPLMVFNFERTLQYLYLECNKITELPRTLFQCEELRYLGLCDNEIEVIPPLIEKLSNLENLLLTKNCLHSESIPSNIHRCQRLKILHLSSNNLVKIPGSITRLVLLKELYLNNCDLEFLPANFGRLNNLRILELRENHLSTLPKSLKRLTNLKRLDISTNMFKKFPEVVGTMLNITELWLNDNFISTIPDYIGNLAKLTHFDVSCNRLTQISNNIGYCTNMTLLLLSMNDLKELPNTIVNLPILHTLKVDHNLLEALPQDIGKLKNLEELDIQYNNLKSFPNSIGMLRKLNSLVAAQNSISSLPTEIGSCTVLSVLSLHYNILMYLPEEIGHLQNLTSISLINNKLQYLPITILSLKKLKALWLSHNQSQPLISLQTETLENGRLVLTCVLLPQVEMPLHTKQMPQSINISGRRIGFNVNSVTNDLSPKLNRIPTPHPKTFIKYQRSLENNMWRNQESISQNVNNDSIYVKEANIIPMKNKKEKIIPNNDNYLQTDAYDDCRNSVSIDNNDSLYPIQEETQSQSNQNSSVNTQNEYIASTNSEVESATENIYYNSNSSNNAWSKEENINDIELCYVNVHSQTLCNGTKPKQPPPYHIAAVYSKGAQFFLSSTKKLSKESEPKHFTQDQPLNILNPQPKHMQCMMDLHNDMCIYENKYEIEIKEFNKEVNEKVLSIVSGLLKLDLINDYNKSLTKTFFKFMNNTNDVNSIVISENILELYLQILKVTKYFLSFQNSRKHFLLKLLEELHMDIKLILDEKGEYIFNDVDVESKEKFTLIHIISAFLVFNYRNEDYEILKHFLCIEKILPETYLEDTFSTVKLNNKDEKLWTKIRLINIAIYFLTINNSNKHYKYIFDKFIRLQRKLQHLLNSHLNINEIETNYKKKMQKKHVENLAMDTELKTNMTWVFGVHKNTKIVKVELTPCCYVLGFSVDHNAQGVFIKDVDKNGNANQKLFMGDKILMLDDRDISKMNPEDAVKAVQIWGPETETFLVSRN